MRHITTGLLAGISLITLLEFGQILTENPNTLFNINYFVKGAFLGMLLAAFSMLYVQDSLARCSWGQVVVSIVTFICALGSAILSFKFILAGFIIHAVASFVQGRPFTRGVAMFEIIMIGYLVYLEFINVGDQVFF